jgi:hypothetical protein
VKQTMKLLLRGAHADGRHALVDAGDYSALATHPWVVNRGGGTAGYRKSAERVVWMRRVRGETPRNVPMGEYVLVLHGQPKPAGDYHVDHINFDVLDNRFDNLRWLKGNENRARTRRNLAAQALARREAA